jgi:hypothetical protein
LVATTILRHRVRASNQVVSERVTHFQNHLQKIRQNESFGKAARRKRGRRGQKDGHRRAQRETSPRTWNAVGSMMIEGSLDADRMTSWTQSRLMAGLGVPDMLLRTISREYFRSN